MNRLWYWKNYMQSPWDLREFPTFSVNQNHQLKDEPT